MVFEDYENWGTVDTSVSFKAVNSAPIDSRFVIDSLDNIDTAIPKSIRYPGLRIYVLDEDREYWFKDDTNTTDLVVYTPETNMTGTNLSDFDTTMLSVGAEATIFNNGNPTKYVWNGNEWKTLGASQSQVTPSPTGGDIAPSAIVTDLTTDTYEELAELINDYVSNYEITLDIGYEISVVFTDPQARTFFNRYVYLPDLSNYSNNHWYLENGTQSFEIQMPNEIINGTNGTTYTSNDNTSGAKYVTYKRNENGVDVVIEHNFCNLFVDVVVYETGDGTEDVDSDGIVDTDYGTIVGIPSTCVKSDNKYKVVISFPFVPSNSEKYIVLMQK